MNLPNLQAYAARFAGATALVPGTARLHLNRGETVTLRTPLPGVLRVQQGRVWATLCCAADDREADHFVTAAQDLPLAAGSSVVLESWPLADGHGALVQWLPA